jgi:2-alkyl-3-oxoalkanoate reductase
MADVATLKKVRAAGVLDSTPHESTTMNVCLTGGTGFVGGALLRRLLAEGASVRVLARPSRRADILEALGAEVVRGDVRDQQAAARAFAGRDVVYHVAAMVEGRGGKQEYFETNVGGTEQVLRTCLREGVRRVVYTSSIAVYGPARKGEPINESTPYDDAPEKRDFYAQSKIEADRLAAGFAERTRLAVTILRPGIVFGPGKALPMGLLGTRLGSVGLVIGRRGQRIPLNYIENLIDAMELAAAGTDPGLQQYIVIDDDNLTLGEYHAAREDAEKTRTVFIPSWPFQMAAACRLLPAGGGAFSSRQVQRALENRWYDTRRIREKTGWAPKVPLKEAMRRSLATTG